jgi:arsenate reductase
VGTHPAGFVHPLTEAALAETGVGIEELRSKSIDEFSGKSFDYVVTVCSDAEKECSTLKGTTATFCWPVDDPVQWADQGQAGRVKGRHVREILTDKILALIEDVK